MMMRRCLMILAACSAVLPASVTGQTGDFDLKAYVQFLETHQNMTKEELLASHPAGSFASTAPTSWEGALFSGRIDSLYALTSYEKQLLSQHGFVVSERLRKDSFVEQFHEAWANDLPLFVSSDAILHAFHSYYVHLLANVERLLLEEKLRGLLTSMHGALPTLASSYAQTPGINQMLKDVDVFLTVPRRLLGDAAEPYYRENTGVIDTLLAFIEAEQLQTYNLFADVCRMIDFSQFRPRGHYTQASGPGPNPTLERYFRAMMWLGRMEIYLLPPVADEALCPLPSPQDIQRQTVDAVLLLELMELARVWQTYEEMEGIISFFVGEQDNVTPENLRSLLERLEISRAAQLLDMPLLAEFQDSLAAQPWAPQKILSQILARDPMSPEQIEPASAFMIFGQRFVIDSYITGSVVFDKIEFNGQPVCRLFPSTLDILFALGNDAAAQLLQGELDEYHYATNLAALRHLVDSYDASFWQSSIHTMWLHAIRAANAPADRSALPEFMQSAAWWQEKMNTQLGSWTELRHDHLLYAKQSYTGVAVCDYPEVFVEPVPEVFERLSDLGRIARGRLEGVLSGYAAQEGVLDYFTLLEGITDTLATVARKELDGVPLSQDETRMLKSLLYDVMGCAPTMAGWYLKLLYGPMGMATAGGDFSDYLVADYHTTPSDCGGILMGWVSHAGTGDVDMAILVAERPDGHTMAFAGPVMSYHEYRTTNFQRLTDEEWAETTLRLSTRPGWVNLYLADAEGQPRGAGPSLITGMTEPDVSGGELPREHLVAQNYPNPFNPSTIISFTIPPSLIGSHTEVTVFSVEGAIVKGLLASELPSGTYLTKWDGTNAAGQHVASGIYLYRVRAGTSQVMGKMMLTR